MSFFDTALWQEQPGRYALVAESCLPLVLILLVGGVAFSPGQDAGANVVGRPHWTVFITAWTLIVIMLFFGLLLVSMHVESVVAVVLIACCYMITTLMCFTWLVVYKQDKAVAAQILLLALGFMLATTVVTASADFDNGDAKVASALFFSLPTAWLVAASMFNYFEINNP